MCSKKNNQSVVGGNGLVFGGVNVQQSVKQAEVHHLYEDFVIRTATHNEFSLTHFVNPNSVSDDPKVIQDKVRRIRYHVTVGDEANQIMTEPNAGGASVVSEALSMELLHRRFGATDVTTEMAIQYWCNNWKKIDYIATIHGIRTGVSVTRAMGYPEASSFTEDDAHRLCYKKLYGLVVARAGISRSCSYDRSILHCFCQDDRIAELMKTAFEKLIKEDEKKVDSQATLTGSIIIILTVCSNFPEVFTDDYSCIQNVI
jgi:hypothetical protein